jgi:hypothetical protein
MFVAIVLPAAVEDKKIRAMVLVAALSSVVMTYVPCLNILSSSWRVILLPVLLSGVAAMLFPMPVSSTSEKRGSDHE